MCGPECPQVALCLNNPLTLFTLGVDLECWSFGCLLVGALWREDMPEELCCSGDHCEGDVMGGCGRHWEEDPGLRGLV
jgi:hypothetical protein